METFTISFITMGSLELDWDYIQNQFYDTVLNNKYFDFWGAELDYQPKNEVYGGEH